jgi:hypothetical protein
MPNSPPSRKNVYTASPAEIKKIFDNIIENTPPPDPSLPKLPAIPTYLTSLDSRWHGGWALQWPMVIAGPKNAGKTQFLFQLLSSVLLRCIPPWYFLYVDLKGDYRLERIQALLKMRSNKSFSRCPCNRIDKKTFPDGTIFWNHIVSLRRRRDLALLLVDGWEQSGFIQKSLWWSELARVAEKKQMGLVITIQQDLETGLSDHPFESIPYLVYITKRKHQQHRIRIWQNNRATKIYDQVVQFKGYLREYNHFSSSKKLPRDS